MKFPVDVLATVSQGELERSAQNYMTNLLYSNPDYPERLTLANSTQVSISISSVGFVPLYGTSEKHKILALFAPSDPFTAVGLYLLGRWWTVEDILRTADPSRAGALEVQTVGERIVLYLLNRVIYRAKEMSTEELPFLCHGENDFAKILWKNGEAVGFYSVKPTGSLFGSFLIRSYQLPVMDSIFVRKSHRGKGFGLQMLEDFVLSFKEDYLGLRYPLTKSMFKVCQKYLCQYPGDTDLLWEVESIGGPNQRTNIASKIQAMDLSAVSKNLSFTEDSLMITEKDMGAQIQEHQSMDCTVEIVEEVTVLKATKVTEEVPVATQTRSSGSKRRRVGEKITEDSKSEKVIRIEDIEAETPKEVRVEEQQVTQDSAEMDKDMQAEAVVSMTTEEKAVDEIDNAPDEVVATMSENLSTVLVSLSSQQNIEEAAHYTSTQVEDASTQDLNKTTSCDTKITVENVTSETEEEQKESENENKVVLIAEKVEESTVIEGKDQDEVSAVNKAIIQHVIAVQEELAGEDKTILEQEQTENREEPRLEESAIKESATELSDEAEVSDDDNPPQEEHSHEAGLVAGGFAEEKADEKATGKGMQEHGQMEQEEAIEKTEEQTPVEDLSAVKEEVRTSEAEEAADEVQPSTEMELEDKEVQAKEKSEGAAENAPVPGADVEAANVTSVADDMIQESDSVLVTVTAASVTVTPEEIQEETESSTVLAAAGEEVQVFSSKLHKATVVLVDLKSTCHPLQVKEAEQTAGSVVKETSHAVVEKSEMLKEEEGAEGENIEGKLVTVYSEKASSDKEQEGTAVVDEVKSISEAETTPVIETRTFRRGRKSNQQQEEGRPLHESRRASKKCMKEMDEGAEESTTAEEEDEEEVGLGSAKEKHQNDEEEAAIHKEESEMPQSSDMAEKMTDLLNVITEESTREDTETESPESKEGEGVQTGRESIHKEESEVEKTAEERIEEEKEGTEGAKHGEEARLLTLEEEEVSETTSEKEEDTKTAADEITQEETNAEEPQREEGAPQLSDLQRVTVVLVDVKKKGLTIQEATTTVKVIVPTEETATVTEDQKKMLMKDETMVEESVPSFPAGKLDEQEMVLVEADTIHDTAEGKQSNSSDTCADGEVETQGEENAEETSETTKVDEGKSADEEEETTITETRALRGKRAVTATPRWQSKRSKQRDEQEEEEAAAENSDEEEPAIKTRVLRRGRKSVTVVQRRKSTRSHKQLQEEEDGEEPTTPAKLDEEKHLDDIEEPVTEHRTLRTGRKAVKATPARKSTRHKQQEEEESATDVSEPLVQTKVPRRGRKSAPVTPKHKEEQERPEVEHITLEVVEAEREVIELALDEEEEGEEIKERLEDSVAPEEVGSIDAEMEEDTEKDIVEEQQPANLATLADTEVEPLAGENGDQTLLTVKSDEAKGVDEEEAMVIEKRVLRSGKTEKSTSSRKSTRNIQKRKGEQEEEIATEKSADEDEAPADKRVLRKGKRPASASSRCQSKGVRHQAEDEESTEEAEQESELRSPVEEEENAGDQRAEKSEEGKQIEVEKEEQVEKLVEEVTAKNTKEKSVVLAEADKMEDTLTEEEAAVTLHEEREGHVGAVKDIEAPVVEEISSAEVDEGSNTAEEEETLVVETSTTITTMEVGPDTAVSAEEGVADDTCVVEQEEVPVLTTRQLRSKSQTVHTAPEMQQQEEENAEAEGLQAEAIHWTDDSSEKSEEPDVNPSNAEQTEVEDTSAENEAGAPAAEDSGKEKDDEAVESTVSEAEREETEMESPNDDMSETKEGESVENPLIEDRTLRSRTRDVSDTPSRESKDNSSEEGDKEEERECPTRRSQRIKPVVNYCENEHEEAAEMEAGIDDKEEEDTVKLEEAEDKKNESSENTQTEIPEENENSIEEKAEDSVQAIETTGEEGVVQSLVLDTDEEAETTGITQDAQEEDQSMSEEEETPVVIRERVLRGRLIPSVIVTPLSKSPRSSRKGKKAEEVLGTLSLDSEKSLDSAQKRNLRKRRSTELTPVCKAKRQSRK